MKDINTLPEGKSYFLMESFWLTTFPDFWTLVYSLLYKDKDIHSFASVCRLWWTIYNKSDYVKFKRFILDPAKIEFLDMNFIVCWDLFKNLKQTFSIKRDECTNTEGAQFCYIDGFPCMRKVGYKNGWWTTPYPSTYSRITDIDGHLTNIFTTWKYQTKPSVCTIQQRTNKQPLPYILYLWEFALLEEYCSFTLMNTRKAIKDSRACEVNLKEIKERLEYFNNLLHLW
jgi:hypothetical protein